MIRGLGQGEDAIGGISHRMNAGEGRDCALKEEKKEKN